MRVFCTLFQRFFMQNGNISGNQIKNCLCKNLYIFISKTGDIPVSGGVSEIMKYEKMRKRITDKTVRAVIAVICLIAITCTGIVYAAADTSETNSAVRKLQNGSFEEGQTWTASYTQPDQSKVPAWNTTAFQGKIELFRVNT